MELLESGLDFSLFKTLGEKRWVHEYMCVCVCIFRGLQRGENWGLGPAKAILSPQVQSWIVWGWSQNGKRKKEPSNTVNSTLDFIFYDSLSLVFQIFAVRLLVIVLAWHIAWNLILENAEEANRLSKSACEIVTNRNQIWLRKQVCHWKENWSALA